LPELRLTRRATDDLRALPRPVQEAVVATLDRIALDPEAEGKELVGRLRGLWSARVGNYRVLYTIEAPGVIVRAIRYRGVAYRGRRRR
jgi:mRNA-degrading endonuclease RelE of RelBE toxin-antitoxin system